MAKKKHVSFVLSMAKWYHLLAKVRVDEVEWTTRNPFQSRAICSLCLHFFVTIFIMMMTQLWLLFVLLLLHVSSSTASLKDDCSCDILNKPSLWHKEETARYVENHFHDVFYDKRDDCGTDHFIARFKIFQPDGWSILSIGVSFQRYPLELSNL